MTDRTGVLPAITGTIDNSDSWDLLPEPLKQCRPVLFSYVSSLFSTTIGYPLDSIKNRIQTHDFKGVTHCLSSTLQNEGVYGLFRGVSAPLVSTAFSRSLSVSIYTQCKPRLAMDPIFPLANDFCTIPNFLRTIVNNAPISFSAGLFAGGVTCLLTGPFEFTKLFSQIYVLTKNNVNPKTMSQHTPISTAEIVKCIIRTRGVSGMYSGFRYHLVRDCGGGGVYYCAYESMKIFIEGIIGSKSGYVHGTAIPSNSFSVPFAGAFAGIAYWIIMFPVDSVKSLAQRDIISNILRESTGMTAIPLKTRTLLKMPTISTYKGLGVIITKAIFASAAFFSCFEFLMKKVI